MNFYKSANKNHWGYVFSTHAIDDLEHSLYVKMLMKKLYNIDPYERLQGRCASLVYTRKDLVLFKKKLGLPMGRKNNIGIPKWILCNEKYLKNCIRGIVDTDGCFRFRKPYKGKLHSYPEIKISNSSIFLINQIKESLIEFGFTPSTNREKKENKNSTSFVYSLNLNGVKNVEKYVKIIGTSNPKHLNKYLFWKKYGFWTRKDMAAPRFEFPLK